MSNLTSDHAHCPACGECLPTMQFVGEVIKPTPQHPHFTIQAPAEVMQCIVACALAGVAMATPGTSTEEMHLHFRMLPVLRMMDQQNFESAEVLLRATANVITEDSVAGLAKKIETLLSSLFTPKPKEG